MTNDSGSVTKHFEESEYSTEGSRIFYHYDKVKEFTPEQVAEANEKERVRNEEALVKILEDGFVEIPIFHRNVDGVLTELKAWVPPTFDPSCSEGFFDRHGMSYNIYVPSYKRVESMTASMLETFGVTNWYFAVDPDQYEAYSERWGKDRIIIRDIRFRDPSMVDLGVSSIYPNTMSGTAGIYNNLLAFSRSLGEKKYWTMDDDFIGLAMKARRGYQNMQPGEVYDKDNYYRCSHIKEEYGFDFRKFMDGLETVGKSIRNHGFLGLEKFGTVFSLCTQWKFGTRVYSFYLSDNSTQPSHRGMLNNDVITSMEQSKRGMPPGLFEQIGYNSGATQVAGGLTDQYKLLGTLQKGKVLVKFQPNFTKITINYNRIHHTGDYTTYNQQRLAGVPVEGDPNPYYKSGD